MTIKNKKRIKAHNSKVSDHYEYGKGISFPCIQQELNLNEGEKNMPKEGDILYYKKRSGSGKINKWKSRSKKAA